VEPSANGQKKEAYTALSVRNRSIECRSQVRAAVIKTLCRWLIQ
jgi:hypothetical protein